MPQARIPFDEAAFRWKGIEPRDYRERAGQERGMGFRGVARHTLAEGQELPARFELRYFELEPGGYSSLEKHRHAHFVVALRGSGRALVGEVLFAVEQFAAVSVACGSPQRRLYLGAQPFVFICPLYSISDYDLS